MTRYTLAVPIPNRRAISVSPMQIPGRGCPPFQKSEALRNFGSIDIAASKALNFFKDRQRIAIKPHLGSVFTSALGG